MISKEDLYKWLSNYNFINLDYKFLEEKEKQSKEIFCLSTTILFWELCLKRIQELQDGYLSAKEQKQSVNMALMERAALETFAVSVVQILSVEGIFKSEFKNKKKNSEYEERAKKLFLGMRNIENTEKISATNITSHLEKIDNNLKELNVNFLVNAYEDLSNFCHPNMPGLTGKYFIKQLEISDIKTPENKENRGYFEVILALLKHFDQNIQGYKKIVEEFKN